MDLFLLPYLLIIGLVALVTAQQYDQYDRDRQSQYDRDRHNNGSQYDRDRYNNSQYDTRFGNQTYNGSYNRDQYGRNPDNRDQYNRDRDYNNRNPNDPYNRDLNRPYNPNDPYSVNNNNSNRDRDQYNRNPNDPYYNRNSSYPNDPYNRDQNNRPFNNPSDPYNRDPNNRNPNDPYNRDPNNRNPNDPYNQDPNRPYNPNDPYRNPNDPNRPYNRDPNDPYNREPNRPFTRDPSDPHSRDWDRDKNADQYHRGDPNRPYNRDPNDPYNRDPNYPYNKDPNDPFNRDPNRQFDNRNRDPNDRDRFGNGGKYDDTNRYGSTQFNNANDNCCREYCMMEDTQRYAHFATKTAYEVVYGQRQNQHKVSNCNPIQIWSINRHGTRFPNANTIGRLRRLSRLHADILRNYEERRTYPDRGRLCDKDLDLFRRWRWNDTINEQNANMLTQQGQMDMKFLARRFATNYEDILREPYSDQVYTFQYTDTDRTHDSYQAYIEELFKGNAFQVHANVLNNERLIRPTSNCRAWQRQIVENPDSMYEYMKFTQSPDYKQMTRDVFRRLGFRYTLNDSIINDMYDMCRYQKAWDLNYPSPWCIVFNKDQLKLLEYAEDLKYYYKAGYGNEINRMVGCPLVKDMYEKFERTVNADGNSGGNKLSVYFTHSITIQTFLAAMGMVKDQQPLRADNYFQMKDRQWKTSVIDPFASNVVATLYQCRSGERYRVKFFLNEAPVNYPDCSLGLCNWDTVKNMLQYASQSCTLDFCDRSGASRSSTSHQYFMIILASCLFYWTR